MPGKRQQKLFSTSELESLWIAFDNLVRGKTVRDFREKRRNYLNYSKIAKDLDAENKIIKINEFSYLIDTIVSLIDELILRYSPKLGTKPELRIVREALTLADIITTSYSYYNLAVPLGVLKTHRLLAEIAGYRLLEEQLILKILENGQDSRETAIFQNRLIKIMTGRSVSDGKIIAPHPILAPGIMNVIDRSTVEIKPNCTTEDVYSAFSKGTGDLLIRDEGKKGFFVYGEHRADRIYESDEKHFLTPKTMELLRYVMSPENFLTGVTFKEIAEFIDVDKRTVEGMITTLRASFGEDMVPRSRNVGRRFRFAPFSRILFYRVK